MKENISLFIATPAYGCQLHIDYFSSMTALLRGAMNSNIEIDFANIGNNSLVPKARNSLISYFYQNPKYTHIVWIDADMSIPNNAIPKMLARKKDIIGLPVPLKGFDENGLPILNVGEIYNFDETGLADVEHVGNAVLMFSRKAVNDIIKVSDEYYDDSKFSRGASLTNRCWDVFKIGVIDHYYLPEDYYICRRFRDLGYNIYVDFTIPLRHNGMYSFDLLPEHLVKICKRNIQGEQTLHDSKENRTNVINIWDKTKKSGVIK